jgi:hypothetical protein
MRKILTLSVFLNLVLAALLLWFGFKAGPTALARWEYTYADYTPQLSLRSLNELGAEDWEFVWAEKFEDGEGVLWYRVYCKRPY